MPSLIYGYSCGEELIPEIPYRPFQNNWGETFQAQRGHADVSRDPGHSATKGFPREAIKNLEIYGSFNCLSLIHI